MKKNLTIRLLLFCLSLLVPMGTHAQVKQKTSGGRVERIHKDSTASLLVPAYRGELQWQVSVNGIAWANIPEAKANTFEITVPLSVYYRAGVKELSCDWIYSDFIKIVPVVPPLLSTTSISSLDADTLICKATVTNTGGDDLIFRGFCWNLTGDPDTTFNFSLSKSSELIFTDTLSGFLPDTTYFMRSFATNWAGISYGQVMTFKTPVVKPVLDLLTLTALTDSSAVAGATVVFDGSGTITEVGICWSLFENPDLTDNYLLAPLVTDTFACLIPGLDPVTAYYFRAFALNEAGIGFSANHSFTTPVRIPKLNTLPVTEITNHSGKTGGKLLFNGGGEVLERGVCYSLYPMPDLTDVFIPVSGIESEYFVEIKELTRYTSYFVRAYATNSAGTGYGNQVELATKADKAILNTTAVTNITASSAQSGGQITDNGGASASQKGLCWATTTNPEITDNKTVESINNNTFSSVMTGLQPNKLYYVRAYSTNPAGTAYGNQRSFTSLIGLPVVITKNTTSITASGAVVSGEVTSASGGTISSRGFYWSVNPNPTSADNVSLSGTGTGNFTATLTGLAPNTIYYVKSFANNQTGTTTGNAVTLTTLIAPPTLSTSATSSITDTGATSGGNVTNAGGGIISARGICWSLLPAPDLTNIVVAGGSGVGIFVSVMSALSPNTKYYVRAFATNQAGTSYGAEVNFTTLIGLPAVTTGSPAVNITSSGARLAGTVTGEGGGTVTTRGVCWSIATTPTISNSYAVGGSGLGSYTVEATGLNPNTTYYFRAYAINQKGISYGAEFSFATLVGLPTVYTLSPFTTITTSSAVGGGTVVSNGGGTVIVRGTCWSTTTIPTVSDPHTSDGSGTGVFASNLTGLAANTTYYCRAYATNEIGTAYGNQVSFITNDDGAYRIVPVLTTSVRSNFKGLSGIFPNRSYAGSNGYSGITFDWDRNQLYIVANNARCYWVIHAPGYGTWSDSNPGAGFIKTVTLTGFVDAESITYLGNNWLMIGDEFDRQIKFYKINDQTTNIDNDSPDLILDPTRLFSTSDALNTASMMEGTAYDFHNRKIYALCQTGSNNRPRLYMWDWSFSGQQIIPGTQVELSGTFQGFNTDFNTANDLYYSPLLRRLFVISGADLKIVEYDVYTPGTPEFGQKIGSMTVPLSNGSSGTALGTASEGICLSPDARYIYICWENNGFGYGPVPHIRTAANNGLPPSLYPKN